MRSPLYKVTVTLSPWSPCPASFPRSLLNTSCNKYLIAALLCTSFPNLLINASCGEATVSCSAGLSAQCWMTGYAAAAVRAHKLLVSLSYREPKFLSFPSRRLNLKKAAFLLPSHSLQVLDSWTQLRPLLPTKKSQAFVVCDVIIHKHLPIFLALIQRQSIFHWPIFLSFLNYLLTYLILTQGPFYFHWF